MSHLVSGILYSHRTWSKTLVLPGNHLKGDKLVWMAPHTFVLYVLSYFWNIG
jgi:hypothetical protein